MQHKDYLTPWLFWMDKEPSPAELRQQASQVDKALDALTTLLDKVTSKKKKDFRVAFLVRLPLEPAQCRRAEALYLQLWHATGSGKHYAEETLLSAVGTTADPASVPFWKQVAALGRVGDTFTGERHRLTSPPSPTRQPGTRTAPRPSCCTSWPAASTSACAPPRWST